MAKISIYHHKPQKEELSEAPQVEELLKNLEFHKAIQNITSRIASAQTIREIVVDIKEDIRNLFNIHILTIYLIDKASKELYTFESDGNEIRFPINHSTFAGCAAQKNKMLHIPDAYNDREIRKIHETLTFDRTLDKITGVLTGQIIACPILRDGLIFGVMEIMNKKGGDKIDDYNQIFLDEIAGVLARAFFLRLNFTEVRHTYGAKFDSLLQKGILTSDQMDKALKETGENGREIELILMDQFKVPKAEIGAALSSFYSCPFTEYENRLPVPSDLLAGISKTTLVNMLWTPLKRAKGKIHVLIHDPSDLLKRNKIEEILETTSIAYEVSLSEDILRFIHRFYESDNTGTPFGAPDRQPVPENRVQQEDLSPESMNHYSDKNMHAREIKNKRETLETDTPAPQVFDPLTASQSKKASLSASPVQQNNSADHTALYSNKISEQTAPSKRPELSDIEDLAEIKNHRLHKSFPVIGSTDDQMPQPLADIVYDAYSRRASDIHFEPDSVTRNVTIRLRVEGQFLRSRPLTDSEYDLLTKQVKTLAHLDMHRRNIIQEGKLTLQRPSGNDISMRVTCIPTRNGMEDTVLHISDRLKKIPLELLGLSENNYATLVNILQQPRGLVLIAGQPHSGATTTLHACLDHINTQDMKIWTVEEQIEIIQNGLRQVQVNPQKGFDFPAVLRSILKADPDVIMAGRIGDSETASICMQAAVQGRLILSSIGSDDFPDTIERCLTMGVDHLVFADAMLASVEQRLINVLCPKCKEKYHPSQEEYEELAHIYGKDAFNHLNILYSNAFTLYRPKGCGSCGHTGYAGRMCVSEILIFTPQIKRMIRRKESPQTIYRTALETGMITMMQDGILKVIQGISDSRHVRLTCLK